MTGILTLKGMGLQIPAGAITLSFDADGEPCGEVTEVLVRLDLWPNWLAIGCAQATVAQTAASRIRRGIDPTVTGDVLTDELNAGLVAMTAFAFAVDGFYDLIAQELGAHPDHAKWRVNRTARHVQVVETLRYHLKIGPKSTAYLGELVGQLFKFRGRAVHPSSKFVAPNYRPALDVAVHPHLVTFSGAHAVQCRALVLIEFERLLERARELSAPDADVDWINRGREEVERLSVQYRIPGDDQPAYPVPAA